MSIILVAKSKIYWIKDKASFIDVYEKIMAEKDLRLDAHDEQDKVFLLFVIQEIIKSTALQGISFETNTRPRLSENKKIKKTFVRAFILLVHKQHKF